MVMLDFGSMLHYSKLPIMQMYAGLTLFENLAMFGTGIDFCYE